MRKIIRILIIAGSLILISAVVFSLMILKPFQVDYGDKIISILNEQNATPPTEDNETFPNNEKEVTVKDVFSFEFDRAYVFHQADCCLSGEDFAENYNLDISINQVENGDDDYLQRIVFVDEAGEFVHLFQCIINEIYIHNKGVVIYPDTKITRVSAQEDDLVEIRFESTEEYVPALREQDKKVFDTENVTKITFYAYYGAGKGSVVPDENMEEIKNWLNSFTVTERAPYIIPPGTNTHCVEIEYEDGKVIESGLDTVDVNNVYYYIESDATLECFYTIISKTSLK
ncbi:MAG: hypothetical protein IKB86_00445 [Clostridia bacterium]|nr:hypothetical protein [Clostridia bacterium]